MPGAFARAIREKQDVRGLVDHDSARIIGRIKSATLRLSKTRRACAMRSIRPTRLHGRDIVESIKRGDIDGSSFGFMPKSQTWRKDGNILVRELNDVDLFDVSPVTFPAYNSTSVHVRSMFPDGEIEIPAEYREIVNLSQEECDCPCAECQTGNHAQCSNVACDDKACIDLHDRQLNSAKYKELAELRLRLHSKL
jgi:HK97 family phage prohead protease